MILRWRLLHPRAALLRRDLALVPVKQLAQGRVFGLGAGDKDAPRDLRLNDARPCLGLSFCVEGPGLGFVSLALNDGSPSARPLLKARHSAHRSNNSGYQTVGLLR